MITYTEKNVKQCGGVLSGEIDTITAYGFTLTTEDYPYTLDNATRYRHSMKEHFHATPQHLLDWAIKACEPYLDCDHPDFGPIKEIARLGALVEMGPVLTRIKAYQKKNGLTDPDIEKIFRAGCEDCGAPEFE